MNFPAPPVPVQFAFNAQPEATLQLVESDQLVRFRSVHPHTGGGGVTAAIIDTGCNIGHRDFFPSSDRVAATVNCMTGDGGNDDDVTDISGHGTHVTGALAANGVHKGVAPECRIVPIKVLSGDGTDDSDNVQAAITRALAWVDLHAETHGISVVNMSVGDDRNYTDDADFSDHPITLAIRALAARNIAVVTASGNHYGRFATEDRPAEGMCFPAIVRQTISVASVYDDECDDGLGQFCRLGPDYGDPATSYSRPDQVTVYTQRLKKTDHIPCGTDIFAPGSWVRSSGVGSNNGSSVVQQGTSQAAPIVAGTVALLQSRHKEVTGDARIDITTLKQLLTAGAETIQDNFQHTNKKPTGKTFLRVNARDSFNRIEQMLAG